MNLPSIIQCGASPPGGHCWNTYLRWVEALRFICGSGTRIFHLRMSGPQMGLGVSPIIRMPQWWSRRWPPWDAPPIVRKLHYVLSHCVCMLFLFGWPPCQRSDVTLMEVSQHALDSLYIRSIWLLYIVMFFVNLIWYLYLFWLNKHCLSLSLSLSMLIQNEPMGLLPDTQNGGLRMRQECRERFSRHRLQRKPLDSDPVMHHGTWWVKRSRHSRRVCNPQLCAYGKRL